MKLNLGCFHRKMYGFVNVDIREDVEPDVVDNIFELTSFANYSIELIHCSHCLEHVTREEALKALKRWYEILESSGILRVAVPNIEEACKHYIYYKDLQAIYTMFWGSGKHDYDFHKTGWDYETLKKDLESVGFIDVKIYDPFSTDYFYFDDYSKCMLPSFNVEYKNGKGKPLNRLMSLNMECRKP